MAVPNQKSGGDVAVRKLEANAPQAIIIEPSRELAEQTLNQLQMFKKHLEQPLVKELLVVGGVRAQDQIAALKAGVDIVVATPGRLEDLISTGQMSLRQCRFFILDEADGLLKVRMFLLHVSVYDRSLITFDLWIICLCLRTCTSHI